MERNRQEIAEAIAALAAECHRRGNLSVTSILYSLTGAVLRGREKDLQLVVTEHTRKMLDLELACGPYCSKPVDARDAKEGG